MVENEFVIYNKKIYKINGFSENDDSIYLQLYSIVEMITAKIYIKEEKETPISVTLQNNENILPYKKVYTEELIDITEFGIFKRKNVIAANDNIDSTIVSPDTSSKIITNLDNFNSNKNIFTGIKNDFTITMQNENVLTDFKKFINASIIFDRLNHSQLFFEIWRSHDLLVPLTIETDYTLQMTTEQSKYIIIKNISFIRNVYRSINNTIIESTENDSLDINIETPLITPNDILNIPLFVVKYFIGHRYDNNFTNISEAYYSPVLVKINITSYLKNENFVLIP